MAHKYNLTKQKKHWPNLNILLIRDLWRKKLVVTCNLGEIFIYKTLVL